MSENVVIKKDRTVTVPASEAKIGVQYDHNVNVITFDCPRYPDDDRSVDMSTMQIYINYMLPDKTLGSYLAENVKVDTNNPDTIHFDWKITRNVTQVKGALQALVCIKKVDAEGNELYHWNTDLIQSFRVGEGMECLETISSDYADVISQLLVNMNTVTGEFEALSADVTARTSEETLQGLVNNAASDEKLRTIVDAYMAANPVGINVDDTLTVSGDAADAKITGDRISELKSDIENYIFTRISQNQFDNMNPENRYHSTISNDGSIVTNDAWNYMVSHKIYVGNNTQVSVGPDVYAFNIAQYKSDNSFISKTDIAKGTALTLDAECSYIRMQKYSEMGANSKKFTPTIVFGNVLVSEYQPYNVYKFVDDTVNNSDAIIDLRNKADKSVSVYDYQYIPSVKTEVGFIDKNGIVGGGYGHTDYIDISDFDAIMCYSIGASGMYGAWYDSEKQLISVFALYNDIYKIYKKPSDDVKYCRLSIGNWNFIIFKGYTPKKWEEPSKTIDPYLIPVIPNEIVLPDTIYKAKDKECNIYHDNICNTTYRGNGMFIGNYTGSNLGQNNGIDYERFFRAGNDITAYACVMTNDLNVSAEKKFSIVNVAPDSLPASINIMAIGDSLSDMGFHLWGLHDSLVGYGCTPNWIGTNRNTRANITIDGKTYTINREALSGGRLEQFVTNSGFNPWWNTDTSSNDVATYLENNNLDVPDYLIVQFTFNDIPIMPIRNYKSVISNIKLLYDSFASVNPNVKMIFSVEPCGSKYKKGDNTELMTASVLAFAKSLMTEFTANTEYPNIYICPSYAFVDRVYGYNNISLEFAYFSSKETVSYDSTHPNAGGGRQIGDAILGVLLAIMKGII